jgi:hypothetical protein
MSSKASDLEYANFGTPEVVKEACYQHFLKEFPGHIIADSQKELAEMVQKGMTKTVYLGGGSYSAVVKSSQSYTHTKPSVQTPQQHLEEFFRIHRGNMRTPAIVAFKELAANAAKWGIT